MEINQLQRQIVLNRSEIRALESHVRYQKDAYTAFKRSLMGNPVGEDGKVTFSESEQLVLKQLSKQINKTRSQLNRIVENQKALKKQIKYELFIKEMYASLESYYEPHTVTLRERIVSWFANRVFEIRSVYRNFKFD